MQVKINCGKSTESENLTKTCLNPVEEKTKKKKKKN